MNRYRILWKRLKKPGYSAQQQVVMYDLDDIAHFIKHLEKDPKVTGAIDVVPCLGDS
jgi:hypothetical protein